MITRTWLKSIRDSFWDEFSKGVSVRSVGGMKWHKRNRGLNRMIASFQHESGIYLVPPRALIEKDLIQHVGEYWNALNNYMVMAQRMISGDQEQMTPEQATALGEAIMIVQHTQKKLQACLRLKAQELPRKITTGGTE